jgi:preprotein translocase subunit YajC
MSLHGLNILLADSAPAAAPAGSGTAAANQPPAVLQFIPFILLFVVLYFIMIRPQQKKAKEVAAMLKTARPGDKVTTSSGIVGVVVSVKDKTISIRSADTKLEVLKSAVAEITERSGDAKPVES